MKLARRCMVAAWFAISPLVAPVALAQPAPAAAPLPAGMALVRQVEGIDEYRLDNGLQLLLVADDSKPTTTVNITYRVGSRHEGYGETGMAHLLEHMLFKGTPTTRNAWNAFAQRGLRANGTTWVDRTNYFASFAASDENLRWYLGWQADAMVNSFVSRADLDSEMTVVRNEMESGENNPFRILMQRTTAAMYDWHNYGKSTIGARSDVENVDIASLQAFYRRYYQPDNATLVIAGRFERAQTLAWVAQTLGAVPRPARKLAPSYTLDPAQDGERSVTVRRNGGSPIVLLGYHVPPAASPDYAAVELLAQVLGDAPGGRLHRRLVQPGLAAQVAAYAFDLAEPGALFLSATLAPGQDVERARASMIDAADSLAREPATAEELERARRQWLNAWDKGFEDPERIGVEMSSAIAQGDWRLYFLARDRVRRVAVADVNRVASERLRRDNRTVGLYLPTVQTERAPAPAKVDVAAQVEGYRGDAAVAAVAAFEPTPANLDARTQVSTLASGMRVSLLPKGARGQAVQARLLLRYGDAASLNGQATTNTIAAALFDKGGAGLTRQQVADRLDSLQAEVSAVALPQGIEIRIATKRERLAEVVRLVGGLLREPAYSEAGLEEVRRARLTEIARQRQEPGALALTLALRQGNPYPRGDVRHVPSFDELEQDVRAVTLPRVVAFQRRFYSPAASDFAAVGDVDVAAVRAALDAAFGSWSRPAEAAAPAYVRAPLPAFEVAPARLVEITPDKQNANLFALLRLPLADFDADAPALLLANRIFGTGTGSRLWKRIREREGLSYSVGTGFEASSFDANTVVGFFAIFAPQNQAKVDAALRDELARSVGEGFTEAELQDARVGLLNARQLARAQDAAIAGLLARNGERNRSFAFDQRIDDALRTLPLAKVNEVWRKYVAPDRPLFVWAGDFKATP